MTKNIDGFRLSTYYHKDRNGKIQQGPAWDFNLSLGNANYLRGAYSDGWYGDSISSADYPYWDRLFEDPAFAQRVGDRWQELRGTILTTEQMMADIDAAVALLSDGNPNLERPAAGEPSNPLSRNFREWRNLGTYLWPNCYFGQGDCPRSPLPGGARPNSYDDYIFVMKDWLESRLAWMDRQFVAPPTMTSVVGFVTMSADRGTIFYTTDGTDPLQPVMIHGEDKLISSRATVQVMVPSNNRLIDACNDSPVREPELCFMHPDYSIGEHGESWSSGPAGIGYENSSGYNRYIRTNIDAAMDGKNTSAYIRIPFDVSAEQLSAATSAQLGMRYDDGFVAYVWSEAHDAPMEIARANAPGRARTVPIDALNYNASATRIHDDGAAVDFQTFDLPDALSAMRVGTNYLIIQGLNQSLTSSDFLMDADLVLRSESIPDQQSVLAFDAPIKIEGNMRVTARAFDERTRRWSGPVSEVYLVESPSLAITELNYHPADPTPAERLLGVVNDDAFEFIEIQNIGDSTTNLVGSRFMTESNSSSLPWNWLRAKWVSSSKTPRPFRCGTARTGT